MTNNSVKKPGLRTTSRAFSDKLPRWRPARITLGLLLLCGGIVGFLPIVGFWMIPLGLAVLSVDSPPIRRVFRRLTVRVEKLRRRRGPARPGGKGTDGGV